MKKRNVLTALVLGGVLLVSCNTAGKESIDPTPELQARWDGFIERWEALDAPGCAAFYAGDGVNVPPSFKINQGREEVEAFYNFLFSMNQSAEYTHTIMSVSYEGDLAVELGAFHVDWVRNDGSTWSFHARSLTHWKRDETGQWHIQAFLFNEAPAENQ